MEKQPTKYIVVAYQLSSVLDGGHKKLEEKTTDEEPFVFLSGYGIALPAFESRIVSLAKGDNFDFTLQPEEAFGSYDAGHIIDVDRGVFTINGHFDHEHISKGALVPLTNEDGNHFLGRVLDIDDNVVKMDLNHPLAGKQLNFTGTIIESRDATDEEIQNFLNRGGGCSCGCDDEECNCHHDHGDCHHDHGDCHHDHGDGCCCGHHH